MVDNVKTLFRLLKIYGKLDLLWFLRDTKYCLIYIVSDTISAIAAILGVFLLSERFGGFGGMSQNEILFMLGYGMLVDGIYIMFFGGCNTGQISRVVGRGQLDHCMIQPVPLLTQLVASGFIPVSGNSILICGMSLTGYAVNQLSLTVTAPWLFLLMVSLICSCLLILAVIYMVSSLAFYAPVAAEEISMVVVDLFASLKNYPLGGLSGLWQTVFCTIVPVGLASWFPSKVLLGFAPDTLFSGVAFPALTMTMTAVFVLIATLIFRKGMRYYAKYGSPRYSGFGHR